MNRIYLDQGATTFPKPEEVYSAVKEGMEHSFNPSRGAYKSAQKTERKIEGGRRKLLQFFDARKDQRLIYSYSGTDGLNTLLYGLLDKEKRVIMGPFEHNAVYRPLKDLEQQGMELRIAEAGEEYEIDLLSFEEECRKGVDYGVFSYTSNVTGISLPIKKMAEILHRYGGKMIIDATQAAGHQKISLKEEGIDYMASSGHKGLFGPMGTGIIILPEDSDIISFRRGGTGIHSESPEMPKELPFRLEAGTLNVPGIFGLIAGAKWLLNKGLDEIHGKEIVFTNRCIEAFEGEEGIEIYSIKNKSQIFSFNIKGKDSQSMASVLDQAYGIALRGGLHCAPLAHKTIDTFPEGVLRASFSVFTEEKDVDLLIQAIKDIIKIRK